MNNTKWSGRQKKALKASIRHWERMRDDPECGERPTAGSCACCRAYFYKSDVRDNCASCPIQVFTGSSYCEYTPYYEAADAFLLGSANFPKEAQKEIDFLNEVLDYGS